MVSLFLIAGCKDKQMNRVGNCLLIRLWIRGRENVRRNEQAVNIFNRNPDLAGSY
jgi:hypothetical protein